jgi:hypothetical protein
VCVILYIYICYNVDIVVLEGIDVFIPGEEIGILHGDISIVGYNQVDMTFGCVSNWVYTTSNCQV